MISPCTRIAAFAFLGLFFHFSIHAAALPLSSLPLGEDIHLLSSTPSYPSNPSSSSSTKSTLTPRSLPLPNLRSPSLPHPSFLFGNPPFLHTNNQPQIPRKNQSANQIPRGAPFAALLPTPLVSTPHTSMSIHLKIITTRTPPTPLLEPEHRQAPLPPNDSSTNPTTPRSVEEINRGFLDGRQKVADRLEAEGRGFECVFGM